MSITKSGRHVNELFEVKGYVSLKDQDHRHPPEFLPENVNAAFVEAMKCLTISCYNASSTMFRLALDLATEPLLPTEGEGDGPTQFQRRNLGPRLGWLFDNGHLPKSLEELAECVREDGNDGAHRGIVSEADAKDLEDFARALFERLFTEPERIRQAEARRVQRRQAAQDETA